MNISFEKKLIFLFAVIGLILLSLGVLLYSKARKDIDNSNLMAHTEQVLNTSEQVLYTLKDFESASRGYVITGDTAYIPNYIAVKSSLDKHLVRLAELTLRDPIQKVRADSLTPLAINLLERSRNAIERNNSKGTEAATAWIMRGPGTTGMEQVKNLIARIQEKANITLMHLGQVSIESDKEFKNTFYLLLLIMLIFLVTVFFIIRNHILYRKKAEQELYLTNEWYYQTLASLGDAVITTDVNGRITFLNKAATALTGWQPYEADGKPIEEVFQLTHEQPGHTVTNPLRESLQQNKITWLAGNSILIRKDNSRLFIDDSAAPVHDKSGMIKGGVLIFRDITAKKKGEDAVKQSEEKFRAFFENSMDAILLTAPGGEVLDANAAACNIFEMTVDELSAAGRGKLVDAEDPRLPGFLEERKRNGKVRSELTHLRPNGEKFEADVSSAIFTDVYGKQKTCMVIHDITARKKAEDEIMQMNKELENRVEQRTKEIIEKEKRYRVTLDNMMEGVQIMDFDWRYIYVNDAAAQYNKYTKEELLNYSLQEKYPGIEASGLFGILKQCMDERRAQVIEYEFVYPDNTRTWFKLSMEPVPEGLFILSIDITERKKAEQERQAYFKSLEEMLFIISHKLRVPVANILGLSTQLDYPFDTQEELKQIAGYMKDSAILLDSFIRELNLFVSETKQKQHQ